MVRDIAQAVAVALLAPGMAIANGEAKWGFQTPQTIVAHQIYDLHTIILGICVLIAAMVFGFMFYAIVRYRRSVGHQAKPPSALVHDRARDQYRVAHCRILAIADRAQGQRSLAPLAYARSFADAAAAIRDCFTVATA